MSDSNLTNPSNNPLLNVIEFEGRNYITSKKVHADYVSSGGKLYEKLKNFNRMIRSIPSYELMIETKSIVEVGPEFRGSDLEPVIKSNSYNPLMLITPTAQRTIEQHLENEASLQAALRTNALGAAVETGDEHARQIAEEGYSKVDIDQNLKNLLKQQSAKIIQLERECHLTKVNLDDCFLSNSQLIEVEKGIKRLALRESNTPGGIPWPESRGYAMKHLKNNFIEEKHRILRTYKDIPQRRYQAALFFLEYTSLEVYRVSYREKVELKRIKELESEDKR